MTDIMHDRASRFQWKTGRRWEHRISHIYFTDYESFPFSEIIVHSPAGHTDLLSTRAIEDEFGVIDIVASKAAVMSNIDFNATQSKFDESLDKVDFYGDTILTPKKDNLYCAGELQRYDYDISEGGDSCQELINEVIAAFPEYRDSDFKCCDLDFIGRYSAYREPYVNAGISWYSWDAGRQDAIREEFQTDRILMDDYYITSGGINIATFHGLKFDCVAGTKQLKVPMSLNDWTPIMQPILPLHAEKSFWGQIINGDSDKTISPLIDTYFYSNDSDVRSYCNQWGLAYPTPADIDEHVYRPWVYGVSYDQTDSAFSPLVIKSYIAKKLFD